MDSSGAVIPKATVLLANIDRKQTHTTTTNSSGVYTFSNLTAGRYRVTAAISESVEVTTRSSPLLLTDQMEVGQLVDREYVSRSGFTAGYKPVSMGPEVV